MIKTHMEMRISCELLCLCLHMAMDLPCDDCRSKGAGRIDAQRGHRPHQPHEQANDQGYGKRPQLAPAPEKISF